MVVLELKEFSLLFFSEKSPHNIYNCLIALHGIEKRMHVKSLSWVYFWYTMPVSYKWAL